MLLPQLLKNGQSKTSSVTVTIDVVGKITLLPTFFTPNGDGSNDEFFIQSEGLHDFSIVILDESGGILFESNDVNFTWDGRDRTSGNNCRARYLLLHYHCQRRSG